MWDGIASILIGLLLVLVAVIPGRAGTELLVGRALPASARDAARRELLTIRRVHLDPAPPRRDD
ncbi:hypothetical protein [Streptomyces antibioticus]|uniref:hypothetical protein n=1 Tax=Streptomyces antibioticus TaxID=1890 RepID=UPI003D702FF1